MPGASARSIKFFDESQAAAESLQATPSMYVTDIALPGAANDRSLSQQFKPDPCDIVSTVIGRLTWSHCPLGDGTTMLCGVSPVPNALEVPSVIDGLAVVRVGARAFTGRRQLEAVQLPAGIEAIDDFAFMETGLRSFIAPAALTRIGVRSFAHCPSLERVTLSEGLESIGSRAFERSPLMQIEIPSSVRDIGLQAFWGTRLSFDGQSPTFSIDPSNPHLLFDEFGCLYRVDEDGLTLLEQLCCNHGHILVKEGTARIGERACKGNTVLETLVLPEGLREIGDSAFAGCIKLREVNLPDTLETVGPYAFSKARFQSLRIPASLRAFGRGAFATLKPGTEACPSLTHVEVDPDNPLFYVEGGVVCLHGEDGKEWALFYGGPGGCVEIPARVNAVGPGCFSGVETVHTLIVHQGIDATGTNAFFFGSGLRTVCVRDGLGSGKDAVVDFPDKRAGRSYAYLCFQNGVPPVKDIYALADSALLASERCLEIFRMMCERLADPVHLSQETELGFCRRINNHLPEVVRLFATGNYLLGFDVLAKKSIINEENFDEVLSWLSDEGEAPAVTRMLELKRTLFAAPVFDFDL